MSQPDQPKVTQAVVSLVAAAYYGNVEQIGPIIMTYAGIDEDEPFTEESATRLILLVSTLTALLGQQLQHEEQHHGHNVSEWLEDMGRRFA